MNKEETTTGRRGFLRGIVAAGSGAAVAVTATKMMLPEEAVALSAKEEPVSKGYHLSGHIAAYYETASF